MYPLPPSPPEEGNAAINDSYHQNYHHQDEAPYEGTNYYRDDRYDHRQDRRDYHHHDPHRYEREDGHYQGSPSYGDYGYTNDYGHEHRHSGYPQQHQYPPNAPAPRSYDYARDGPAPPASAPRDGRYYEDYHHHQQAPPPRPGNNLPPSMDQQFEEFLQQEANIPAFQAALHHQEGQQQRNLIDQSIYAGDQTVVSEVTLSSSASLFRGPLYQRPQNLDVPDEDVANLFNRNNGGSRLPPAASHQDNSDHHLPTLTEAEETNSYHSKSQASRSGYPNPRDLHSSYDPRLPTSSSGREDPYHKHGDFRPSGSSGPNHSSYPRHVPSYHPAKRDNDYQGGDNNSLPPARQQSHSSNSRPRDQGNFTDEYQHLDPASRQSQDSYSSYPRGDDSRSRQTRDKSPVPNHSSSSNKRDNHPPLMDNSSRHSHSSNKSPVPSETASRRSRDKSSTSPYGSYTDVTATESNNPPSSMDQQFQEFLQQEADNPAFQAALHYSDDEDQQPDMDKSIHAEDQTVVSELTLSSSASLFRGPLYQNAAALDVPDHDIDNLFQQAKPKATAAARASALPTLSEETRSVQSRDHSHSPTPISMVEREQRKLAQAGGGPSSEKMTPVTLVEREKRKLAMAGGGSSRSAASSNRSLSPTPPSSSSLNPLQKREPQDNGSIDPATDDESTGGKSQTSTKIISKYGAPSARKKKADPHHSLSESQRAAKERSARYAAYMLDGDAEEGEQQEQEQSENKKSQIALDSAGIPGAVRLQGETPRRASMGSQGSITYEMGVGKGDSPGATSEELQLAEAEKLAKMIKQAAPRTDEKSARPMEFTFSRQSSNNSLSSRLSKTLSITDLPTSSSSRLKVLLLVGCLVVIGAVVGGVCGSGMCGSSSESSTDEEEEVTKPVVTTSAPTTFRSTLVAEYQASLKASLGNDYFEEEDAELLEARVTALDWIINEDPLQLEFDAEGLLQRYLLALFFFQTTRYEPWTTCNPPSFRQSSTCYYTTSFVLEGEEVVSPEAEYSHRWLSDYHECWWAGIDCSGGVGNVTEIRLRNNNLNGPLPTELAKLSALSIVDLELNKLTGEIPMELINLKGSLKELILPRNQFVGTIPAQLFQELGNLQTLNLAKNSLTGAIPHEAGNFSGTELQLHFNTLTGTVPTELFGLENLTLLDLSTNYLSGTISSSIGRLASMNYLHLDDNNLRGTIPPQIGNMSSLVGLDLSGNRLDGTIPEQVFTGSGSNLEYLRVKSCGLSGTLSSNLGLLTGVIWLDFSANQFHGTIPIEVGSLSNLKEFDVSTNGLSGFVPEEACSLRGVDIVADCWPDEESGIPMVECPGGCCRGCDTGTRSQP